ncbi:hypothetical protein PMAYCL1PPCAC_02059, partial [Pristionchus mayeri]
PLLLLSSLIYHTVSQGCGCRGSSSCGQGGCGSSGGCTGAEVGNNYASSYQRDEERGFQGSLERLGSKRKRGRNGNRGEKRRRKYEDDYDEEEKSVNYDSEYDESDRRRRPTKIRDPKKR